MADMTKIQEQSRKSFFQWHVLLVLKKKQLERTLSAAGMAPEALRDNEESRPPVYDSDELALLQVLGLPIPEDLGDFDLPERETLAGIRFFFRAAPAFDDEHAVVLDLVRQRVEGGYERREILRVAFSDRQYARRAAEKFNHALEGHGIPVVLNAARVWSLFHGGVVMDWEPISARLLGGEPSSDEAWYLTLADPDETTEAKKKRWGIKLDGADWANFLGET